MSEESEGCFCCPKRSCDGSAVAVSLRTHTLKKRFDDAMERSDLEGMLGALDRLIALHKGNKKTVLALVGLKSKVLSKTWRLQDRFDMLREYTCVPSGDLDTQGRGLMQSLRAEKHDIRKRLHRRERHRSLRGSSSDGALFTKQDSWRAIDRVTRMDEPGSLEVRSLSEPNVLTPRGVVIEVTEHGDT